MEPHTQLISLLKEMIATPSLSGAEGNLVDLLVHACKELGFDEMHIDR
ncbi:MAG: YgeY family selenium metabolism-linked hydrolase, partial [Spirochaetales bacterium]|nr:YgeY family selenium metabolism-linked hydrolase [Spirochaetales bacterium]